MQANVWESMGKPCSYAEFIVFFYYKSPENVSGTTSHMHHVWTCNEIQSSYDKIIIIIVLNFVYQKKYHPFVAAGIATHAANS